MCGIAGILNLTETSPPEERLLRRMLGQIEYRGPDEAGIYLHDRVGMGNVRLSILDLSGGAQPIGNEDQSLWIVYNGEVFNHPELRGELQTKGHRFTTETDTEVVLHMYEEYGADCLERLNGQFAFALWDEREKSLFLARDRSGIRPLYYVSTGTAFLFGSEIKALFAVPGVTREFDPVGLRQVFTYWSALSPRTCFKGVFEVPPGHYMKVESGKPRVSRYWALEFGHDRVGEQSHSARPESSSVDELAEELRVLLTDATRIRLRADVPVGAYLSGGLDSSAIGATIRQLGVRNLDTFSISFSDPNFDESEPQRRMAEFLGTEHQVVFAEQRDIGRVFTDVVRHAETVLMRTAPAPMFMLSRLVRDRQYKVVLTGEGADEFLAGYDIFKEAKVRRFWASQPGSACRPALLQRLYPDIGRLAATSPAFMRAFFGVGLEDTEAPDYSHAIRWRNGRRTCRFFTREVRNAGADADTEMQSEVEYPPGFRAWDPLERAQYLEAKIFLSGYLLSSQGDRMAMAHSVEGRYPFLDPRVVEFCSRLPAKLKLRGLQEKWLLRQAMRESLPAEVRTRRKRPYRAPVHRCFVGETGVEYVADLFSEKALRRTGVFNPEPAKRLWKKACESQSLGETDEMALVGMISAQLLHELFISTAMCHGEAGSLSRLKRVDRRTAPLVRACQSVAEAPQPHGRTG